MFTLIQQGRNELHIVSWASLFTGVGMSVGSPVHCACRGVGGQECTALLHCVGASLGTLRHDSQFGLWILSSGFFWNKYKRRKVLCDVNSPHPGKVLFSLLRRALLKTWGSLWIFHFGEVQVEIGRFEFWVFFIEGSVRTGSSVLLPAVKVFKPRVRPGAK